MEDILKHYYHINKHAFDNLDIPKSLLQEWQSIINLLAHLGGASTGIIMKVEQEELSVLVASQSEENPYNVGDKAIYEDSGLYCAAVMMSQESLYVLLRNTTAQQAVAIAENIRQKVANHTYIGEQHVTASIGVAEWLMDETVADWYNRADQALYTAKRQGRNTVRLYESE